MKIAIAGAGPAGVFAAITAAEANPSAQIVILERSQVPLQKLANSGAGRGNLTVTQSDPTALTEAYPRGGKELLGPLHQWGPIETAEWFAARGVALAPDGDGGLGPASGRAADLSECLLRVLAGLPSITLVKNRCVTEARVTFEGGYRLWFKEGEPINCDRLLIATGGAGKGYGVAEGLGHTIVPGKPTLFNFHTPDSRLRNLQGMAVEHCAAWLPDFGQKTEGRVEVLPKGLGGRCIARLSSLAALELAACMYQFRVQVNWVARLGGGQPTKELQQLRLTHPRRLVLEEPCFEIPQKLWERIAHAAAINAECRWGMLTNRELQTLAGQLACAEYAVDGHSMHKEEWMTSGGVALHEVDFKTMRSKLKPALWLAGEVLDIDGLPGGYNFQSAWTTGWIAGKSLAL
ncbi:MAG: aminoacetone oxidase family FAD-binding enzyme [Verrucomicrobiota bacterium]|nr:aminoacetone oxidase family FAD-binding enzyme [Verrucomicrobiota bacterium]